jgi:hypothetical protein
MGVFATFFSGACLVCALLGAQPALVNDEASVARIKAGLLKPAPKLVIAPPKADFRVNIDAIRPFADIFEVPPWVTPPSRFDAPKTTRDAHDGTVVGVGVDPGAVARSISNAIRQKRAHAEVIEAIVEYCRLHRDEPGAAGICGGPPR